jgi:UDP-glucose 4-epimerase
MAFRYFNAAGAALDGSIGEAHSEESHLIPNVILKALKGEEFVMFGNDYDTPDGTAIRDYIHVLDLVDSHSLGLKALEEGKESNIYNIGIGKGYSNLEVVKMIEEKANIKVNLKFGPRRMGDANILFASNDKIKNELGWSPRYGLDKIVEAALLWHKNSLKNILLKYN